MTASSFSTHYLMKNGKTMKNRHGPPVAIMAVLLLSCVANWLVPAAPASSGDAEEHDPTEGIQMVHEVPDYDPIAARRG